MLNPRASLDVSEKTVLPLRGLETQTVQAVAQSLQLLRYLSSNICTFSSLNVVLKRAK